MKHALRNTVVLSAALAAPFAAQAQSWEPTKNVEFIIPAGTGGGADQMARAIQGIVATHGLMKQSILPINRSGRAGDEGCLDGNGSPGAPPGITTTPANLSSAALATGARSDWRDRTGGQLLGLGNLVLWANGKAPYTSGKGYVGGP